MSHTLHFNAPSTLCQQLNKLNTNSRKYFATVSILLVILLGKFNAFAQPDSVKWTFGSPGTPAATATFSSNGNVLAIGCVADTGNACCAFGSASGYSTLYFTNQFPSSGYPAASGEPTMRNNAKTGALNTATSTYFSFLVTPAAGSTVEIKEIHFAGLKNITGPTGYTIRTSADGYTANVGTGSFSTSYGTSKKSHTGLSIPGTPGTPITVRIYTHNSMVTGTGGNVFLDDVVIYYTVSSSAVTGVATSAISGTLCTGKSVSVPYVTTGTFTAGNTFTAQLSDASGSFANPVNIGTLSSTASGTINATIPAGTPAGAGYRIRVTSSTPALTAADNGVDLNIGITVTPSVSIAANPGTTVCAGSSATFTATPVNGGATPTYQWKKGAANVGTNTLTYTDNGLTNGNVITVVMTSSDGCATPATATSNALTMTVSPSAANSVTIAASATSICAGTPVTFTATVPSVNNGPLVTLPGTNLICTQAMTATSSCVSGFYASGWSGSGYWQYQVNTTGYENIVFSTPTSSSGTGPHTGTAYYSTNGVNYTLLNSYSWSGTGCSSTGNINLPPAADNQATLYIRLIMTGASGSGGTNRVSSTSTFKGKVIQPGFTHIYQWKKNGTSVGTNSNIYTDNALADNDQVWVEVSAATCVNPAVSTSNTITMNVDLVLTPSVSIVNSANNICAGTSVTFTATPTNGGTTPQYQWKVNGGNVGTNSSTYSTTTLANNDIVTCVLTPSGCVSPATATSNGITMSVNPILTPTVSIAATFGAICAGTSVTFTATPVNGGSSPSYQWKKNNVNVGLNTPIYTDNTLVNGDIITVEMTSSYVCPSSATATSNAITMVVSVPLTPSVSIAAAPGSTICAGTSVAFTATPTNGGASPVYQWKKNNTNVGTNSATYTDNTLASGDMITVEMTSNAVCLAVASATSPAITMTVNPIIIPSVTLTVGPDDTICDGTMTTFTAVPLNPGTIPVYQWKKNNVAVGTNNAVYTDNTLAHGDIISLDMTSNATCATPATVSANNITMTVNPLLPTSVTMSLTPNDTICAGTSVTFTAKPKNGGTTPTYQWKKNAANVGTNSATFTDNTFVDGDLISVVMTSNAICPTPATVGSAAPIAVTVRPVFNPVVTITANPGTTLVKNQMIYFTANIFNAGANPKIHWEINGVTIPGIKGDNYFSSILNPNDTIVCIVESTDTCSIGNTSKSNGLVMKFPTGVEDAKSQFENLTLYPNPNTGTFTIKGELNTHGNVKVEVLNALGQLVYTSSTATRNNMLDEQIIMPALAKGAYLVRLQAAGESRVLRFVVQ